MKNNLRDSIFTIKNGSDFNKNAIEVFNYQYENNAIYHSYVNYLRKTPEKISNLHEIPFLPVEFFRNRIIITGRFPVDIIFESSGTESVMPGRHFVKDLSLYEESFLKTFRLFYGNPEEFMTAALLPSYTERRGSSLVYMVDKLIKMSRDNRSGFYNENIRNFLESIKTVDPGRGKLLIGVSFALLDLAEQHSPDLSGFIVMETGGMKGRRKELTRQELHSILKEKFKVHSIHSEYGMTELMSQAYSREDGIFYCPPWMKVLIRDPQDPLTICAEPGKTGGINIIDLANINSVSFIATGDLGRLNGNGGFEVLGRFDNSDIRGCNLLVQ